MAYDREKFRRDSMKRHKEAHERKDDSGRFKGIIKPEYLNSIKFFKPAFGEHMINVVPFQAGPNHPNVPEGEWAYNVDLWVHRGVGPKKDNYICLSRSFDLPCPRCEAQAEMMKDENISDKEIEELNPTRRCLYNIECLDSQAEMEKGLQVWDESHFLFEKHLAAQAKEPREGGFVFFEDFTDGKIIYFDRKKASYKDKNTGEVKTSVEYAGLRFINRTETTECFEGKALVLDQILAIPSYEEVYRAHHGKRPGAEEAANAEGDVPAGLGNEPAKAAAGSLPDQAAGASSVPSRRPPPPPPAAAEAASGTANTATGPLRRMRCPDGGTFGTDCGTRALCETCNVYALCEEAYTADKLKDKAPAPVAPAPAPATPAPAPPPATTGTQAPPLRRRPGR